MRTSALRNARANPKPTLSRRAGEFNPLHFLLLLSLALGGTALLAAVLVRGIEGVEFETFLFLLAIYAAASVSFLIWQARSTRLRFFDIPVFLTITCFIRFGLVPLSCFLNPQFLNPFFHGSGYSELNRALEYCMAGMCAFWIGCRLASSRAAKIASLARPDAPKLSPVNWAILLFLVSVATRIYITWNYGYGYALDKDLYLRNLAVLQVLMFLSDLGVYALLLATIEMCYHPRAAFRAGLFVVIFLNELFWGALSGMKFDLFRGFLILALVASITKARLEKKWIAAVLLGLIVIYPINDRYRNLLRGGQVNVRVVGSLGEAGGVATVQTAKMESGWSGWIEKGWQSTMTRLDLLQDMAVVLNLSPAQVAHVHTEERWWMLPIYPFIPRLLWRTKPVLNGGARLSLALGSSDETSTALTYPGDLYMDWGLPGIEVGMLVLGLIAQLLTNTVRGRFEKRSLFFYSAVFVSFAANVMETQAFSVWAGLLKLAVILAVMSYLIYGRPRQDARRPFRSQARERAVSLPAERARRGFAADEASAES